MNEYLTCYFGLGDCFTWSAKWQPLPTIIIHVHDLYAHQGVDLFPGMIRSRLPKVITNGEEHLILKRCKMFYIKCFIFNDDYLKICDTFSNVEKIC
jgi:hypothetical protein